MAALGHAVGVVAQYARDTLCILRSPFPLGRRARLWLRLTSLALGFRGGTILGYRVTRFNERTLFFLYREIFARQCYLFEARTPRPFILDCGANIGMAVLYFKWLYPGATIWAFEPEPRSYAALEQNVAQNRLADVSTHNIALWDRDGELDLIVPGDSAGSIAASVNLAGREGVHARVPCARLSSFINRDVDFLKIDIEGAELPVVQELVASGKIARVRQMVIEYHHNVPAEPAALSRLLGLLEQAGFSYQLSAWTFPPVRQGHFQAVMIAAFRPSSQSSHPETLVSQTRRD